MEKKNESAAEGTYDNKDLNTNGAKVELGKIRENGEIKCSSEREEGKEGKEGNALSLQRAQHTLRETEKMLSSISCNGDLGKDTDVAKVLDRSKSRSPMKMTRSMSFKKKRPLPPPPPPPKAEVGPSGITEEQLYLSQISCIKALKESLEEILECIEDKDAAISQLKQEMATIKETISQSVLVTQSPVLRRRSSQSFRRPQSCLELISEDNVSKDICTNHEAS